MDEARRVLERLERIDALQNAAAPPRELLAELRELVRDAEEWVRAEPGGTDLAAEALERCRSALEASAEPAPERGLSVERTLLA